MMKGKGMGGILAILAKKPMESEGSEEKSTKDSKGEMKQYAQELIDAVQAGDAEAVATAFADLAECYAENGYPEMEDESEDE